MEVVQKFVLIKIQPFMTAMTSMTAFPTRSLHGLLIEGTLECCHSCTYLPLKVRVNDYFSGKVVTCCLNGNASYHSKKLTRTFGYRLNELLEKEQASNNSKSNLQIKRTFGGEVTK